jgi:endonuclease/exonuclease/phosphatase family metal-dependent hydrolase
MGTRRVTALGLSLLLFSLSAGSALAAERSVKVLTYNVWGLPAPLTGKPARFEDLPHRVPDLDAEVIAFQETFARKSHVLAKMPSYPHLAWGPKAEKGRLSSGLLIVSRHRIVSAATMTYSRCSGTDCLANKGALYARIDVPGLGEVDFFTTHLNAGRTKSAEKIRRSQLAELFRFMAHYAQGGRPAVLCGDFNFEPGTAGYLDARAVGLRDAHAEYAAATPWLDPIERLGYTMDTERNGNMRWARAFADPSRIDFFWIGGATRVERTALAFDFPVHDRYMSDHFGVVADLRITTSR